MSVINETLDNLKQSNNKKPSKKNNSKALNPSSSAYCEEVSCAEHHHIALRPYIISISFAVLIGVFFYISYSYFFTSNPTIVITQKSVKESTHLLAKRTTPASSAKEINNPLAQNQYYQAMSLLNAGKEAQAIESLQQIIKDYPDFKPAQKVYSMLTVH